MEVLSFDFKSKQLRFFRLLRNVICQLQFSFEFISRTLSCSAYQFEVTTTVVFTIDEKRFGNVLDNSSPTISFHSNHSSVVSCHKRNVHLKLRLPDLIFELQP